MLLVRKELLLKQRYRAERPYSNRHQDDEQANLISSALAIIWHQLLTALGMGMGAQRP